MFTSPHSSRRVLAVTPQKARVGPPPPSTGQCQYHPRLPHARVGIRAPQILKHAHKYARAHKHIHIARTQVVRTRTRAQTRVRARARARTRARTFTAQASELDKMVTQREETIQALRRKASRRRRRRHRMRERAGEGLGSHTAAPAPPLGGRAVRAGGRGLLNRSFIRVNSRVGRRAGRAQHPPPHPPHRHMGGTRCAHYRRRFGLAGYAVGRTLPPPLWPRITAAPLASRDAPCTHACARRYPPPPHPTPPLPPLPPSLLPLPPAAGPASNPTTSTGRHKGRTGDGVDRRCRRCP